VESGDEKGMLWITVGDDAPAGRRWLRIYDDEGASALRPFLIGTIAEAVEKEPNNDLKHAQVVDFEPVTINGKLAVRGDVDGFAVRLSRGQTLVASLEANRQLGSPMDAILQVVNRDGFVLAHNDDERDRDPQLVFEAPRDNVYIVRTFAFPATPDARIGFSGSETYIYRLTLSTGGFFDHTFPLAVARDGSPRCAVRAEGWNIPESAATIAVHPELADRSGILRLFRRQLANTAEVLVVDHPVVLETEPNSIDIAQPVTPPVTICGRSDTDGDRDVYRFRASKGATFTIRADARVLGFPLDPTLRLIDDSGRTLAEADDSGGRNARDAELSFTAPDDGHYRLIVRDLNSRGGPRYLYRASILPRQADVRLTLKTDRYSISPGKRSNIQVDVDRRNGFDDPVVVEAIALPEGVTAKPVTSTAKGESMRSVNLILEARDGARAGPFCVLGRIETGPTCTRFAEARVEGFDATTADAWLSVAAPTRK
jgi:hypothetical protein